MYISHQLNSQLKNLVLDQIYLKVQFRLGCHARSAGQSLSGNVSQGEVGIVKGEEVRIVSYFPINSSPKWKSGESKALSAQIYAPGKRLTAPSKL